MTSPDELRERARRAVEQALIGADMVDGDVERITFGTADSRAVADEVLAVVTPELDRLRQKRNEYGERITEEFAARQEALADLAAAENVTDYTFSALAERLEDSGMERPENLVDALDHTKWAMDVLAWLHAEAVWRLRGMARRVGEVRQSLRFADAHVPQWERIIGEHKAEIERLQDELVTQNRLYRKVGAERDEKQCEVERLRRWVDRFREGLRTATAERDALRAQLNRAVVLPDDAVHDLIAFWHTKHNEFLDDAARALLARWAAAPVSESVPATPGRENWPKAAELPDPDVDFQAFREAAEEDAMQYAESQWEPLDIANLPSPDAYARAAVGYAILKAYLKPKPSGVDLPEVEATAPAPDPNDVDATVKHIQALIPKIRAQLDAGRAVPPAAASADTTPDRDEECGALEGMTGIECNRYPGHQDWHSGKHTPRTDGTESVGYPVHIQWPRMDYDRCAPASSTFHEGDREPQPDVRFVRGSRSGRTYERRSDGYGGHWDYQNGDGISWRVWEALLREERSVEVLPNTEQEAEK